MKNMKMNRYIVLLLISEVFALGGFGLIDPIFAVFVTDHIHGGSIATVGFAISIFMITKSLIQLPFSWFVDKYDDAFDLRWLVIGSACTILTPIIYFYSTDIWHVYIAEFVLGVGSGLSYPAWLGIWSTHLDVNKESFEWSFYSTVTGIVTALSASFGAVIAEVYGFHFTFLCVLVLSIVGVSALSYIWILHIRKIKKEVDVVMVHG